MGVKVNSTFCANGTTGQRDPLQARLCIRFTWSGPRGVAGYTEAQALCLAVMPARPNGSGTPCKLPYFADVW
jgi:hypothetical protein